MKNSNKSHLNSKVKFIFDHLSRKKSVTKTEEETIINVGQTSAAYFLSEETINEILQAFFNGNIEYSIPERDTNAKGMTVFYQNKVKEEKRLYFWNLLEEEAEASGKEKVKEIIQSLKENNKNFDFLSKLEKEEKKRLATLILEYYYNFIPYLYEEYRKDYIYNSKYGSVPISQSEFQEVFELKLEELKNSAKQILEKVFDKQIKEEIKKRRKRRKAEIKEEIIKSIRYIGIFVENTEKFPYTNRTFYGNIQLLAKKIIEENKIDVKYIENYYFYLLMNEFFRKGIDLSQVIENGKIKEILSKMENNNPNFEDLILSFGDIWEEESPFKIKQKIAKHIEDNKEKFEILYKLIKNSKLEPEKIIEKAELKDLMSKIKGSINSIFVDTSDMDGGMRL